SGPMIFGLSKAIAREHNAIRDADVLIMDLTNVPILGVTASLAIENAIRDAHDRGLQVYLVGASEKVRKRLSKLGLFDLIHPEHVVAVRIEALQKGVDHVYTKGGLVPSAERG
ncbi:MAG: SulP family inorganic anion transporter, partial [Gloeomargaritaceae cyanobacterium C42_A2020_066]|nr:SulP family inorganic anion transporter [Gloeomargaritaceae cyanobacterium C42_A2020_066]